MRQELYKPFYRLRTVGETSRVGIVHHRVSVTIVGKSLNRAQSASDGTKHTSTPRPRAGAWGSDQRERCIASVRSCSFACEGVGHQARKKAAIRLGMAAY